MACEPSSAYVPSLVYESNLAVVPFSSSILNNTPSNISSDTDSDDEHPPPPAPAPLTTSQLPRWVRSTRKAASDLIGDPTNQHHTHSHF